MKRELTPKQKRFVAFYDGNATQAAIKAGYSEKTAHSMGAENLRKPEIINAIAQREGNESRPRIASRQQRQQFWTEIMHDPEAEMRDRLKASELLGKSEGDFLDRLNIAAEQPIVIVRKLDHDTSGKDNLL